MLENLINLGKSYKLKFTTEYSLGVQYGIDLKLQNQYLQWLSKIGMFAEAKLKNKFPNMTSYVLNIIEEKSVYDVDYNIIMGYLESAKELGY